MNHIWHSNDKKMQYSIFQICNFSFYEKLPTKEQTKYEQPTRLRNVFWWWEVNGGEWSAKWVFSQLEQVECKTFTVKRNHMWGVQYRSWTRRSFLQLLVSQQTKGLPVRKCWTFDFVNFKYWNIAFFFIIISKICEP